jgi:hypothetical protein
MIEVPNHIQLVLDYDRLFRSQVLYEGIALESAVDQVIAWHYCSEPYKHASLFSFVFRDGEITFGKKIRILSSIMKESYPELAETFSSLRKQLDRLRVMRNKFAHSELVLPENPPDPKSAAGVTLRYYEKGKEKEAFVPKADIDRLVDDCRQLHLAALMLCEILKRRALKKSDERSEGSLIRVARACFDKINMQ